MATTNFAYVNRCIVVTDEDYNFDNVPRFSRHNISNNRNFPQFELEEDTMPDLRFLKAVLTDGYYEGACIDYVRNDQDVEYYLGDSSYYQTKKDVINECIKEFKLSRYRLNKILPKMKKDISFEQWYEEALNALYEYLIAIEETVINEYLDNLKKEYGYDEVKLTAVFSNGEGIYQKI